MYGETWARSALLGIVSLIVILVPQILFAQIPNGPDLAGQWENLTQDCKLVKDMPQCMIKGKLDIRNQGDVSAEGSKLVIILSGDSVVQPEDTILKEINVSPLKPGQARKTNVKIALPPGMGSANQFVIGVFDSDNLVTEADENNNTAVFGPFPSGDEYFPFTVGSVWSYQGTITGNLEPPTTYINTVKITGQHMVGGVLTTVFADSSNSAKPLESYYLKDASGIMYYGGSGTSNFTPFFAPSYQFLFPVKIKSTVKQSRQGVDIGEDLDGDGINEIANVNVKTTPAGYEDISTPAGSFTNCLKIVSTMTLKVQSSAYPGRSVSIKIISTEWNASGIGAVRRSSQVQARAPGSELIESLVVEDLIGYAVDGQKKGQVHLVIAEDVVNGSSDKTYPGRTSISSDGTNFLVLYPCDTCSPAGLWGSIISSVGEKLNSFAIPTSIPYMGGGTVAFDGANYLIVAPNPLDGQLLGFRASPSGTLLDPIEGFLVSINGGPPAASFGKDNYLFVWGRYVIDPDIYGAIVTPNGQVVNEFPIYAATGEDVMPSVAFDGANYFVTWQSRYGWPEEHWDIMGARITQQGVVLDTAGITISTGAGYREYPHISFDGTNYLVVWQDTRNYQDGFSYNSDIYGARISPNGALLDGPPDTGGIPINTAPYPKYHPRVTFDGEKFLVVWEISFFYEPPVGIFAAAVTPTGEVIDYTETGLGTPINDLSRSATTRFVNPGVFSNGVSSLATYTRMEEMMGEKNDILGTIIVWP
jgi:hypothetical protein